MKQVIVRLQARIDLFGNQTVTAVAYSFRRGMKFYQTVALYPNDMSHGCAVNRSLVTELLPNLRAHWRKDWATRGPREQILNERDDQPYDPKDHSE